MRASSVHALSVTFGSCISLQDREKQRQLGDASVSYADTATWPVTLLWFWGPAAGETTGWLRPLPESPHTTNPVDVVRQLFPED